MGIRERYGRIYGMQVTIKIINMILNIHVIMKKINDINEEPFTGGEKYFRVRGGGGVGGWRSQPLYAVNYT